MKSILDLMKPVDRKMVLELEFDSDAIGTYAG